MKTWRQLAIELADACDLRTELLFGNDATENMRAIIARDIHKKAGNKPGRCGFTTVISGKPCRLPGIYSGRCWYHKGNKAWRSAN